MTHRRKEVSGFLTSRIGAPAEELEFTILPAATCQSSYSCNPSSSCSDIPYRGPNGVSASSINFILWSYMVWAGSLVVCSRLKIFAHVLY